jgi:hypothetical protein
MTVEELQELIKQPESDILEFKHQLSDPALFAMSVSVLAMGNLFQVKCVKRQAVCSNFGGL